MNNRLVRIGDLDVHYITVGQGEPLIILHGGGDGSNSWLQSAMELSNNYTVYVPDLPGFGLSQPIGDDFRISEFVTFIDDFSRNLGLKHFHILGHSVGGCIALRYTLKFPHRIKKLVLVSSMCLGKEIAPWIRFLANSFFSDSLGLVASVIIRVFRWLGSLLYAPLKQINPLPQIKLAIGRRITTWRGQTTIFLSQLSNIVVPTLIIWGAKDGIVPAKHAYAAADQIRDCQLHIIEDVGHMVHKHSMLDFSKVLTNFLG